MSIKVFTSATMSASDVNTYCANSGLVYVASKTWSMTTSAQQIDDCFTSIYDNYRVVYVGIGNQTTAQALMVRLVDGTTPNTGTTYYTSQNYVTNSSGPSMYWSGAAQQFNVGWVADINSLTTFDIASPQLAAQTVITAQSSAYGTANTVAGTSNDMKIDTTQYEGIYLFPAAGTSFAGTLTIFGYRKA